MGVTTKQLEALKGEMPYKWRIQSVKYGKATAVAYVDSRQVQDKFDEALGADNWQDDYREVRGMLFAGIGVNVDNGGGRGWIWKWDTGSEANMEAEKSIVSDSFKRAAVKWGVGRFLYTLKILELGTKEYKGKEYPADANGNILWSADNITAYCNELVSGRATTKQKKTEPAPKKPVKIEEPKTPAIQPNTSFDDSNKPEAKPDDRKQAAEKEFNKLDQSQVLKYLIKEKKYSYPTIADFIKGEKIETILEVYQNVKGFKK